MVWVIAAKELLLLRRDLHGLLLLFAMPCVFVLIMSFALQNQFGEGRANFDFFLLDQDNSEASKKLSAQLGQESAFKLRDHSGLSQQQILDLNHDDEVQFTVQVYPDFQNKLLDGQAGLSLKIAPSTDAATAQLFTAFVREKLARILLTQVMEARDEDQEMMELFSSDFRYALNSEFLFSGEQERPSAVQQNVPAWLLFAMFFITIPLSTTFIQERSQGTLSRLHSMGVGNFQIMLGKLLPFFAISMLQVAAMMAVGMLLIPALGGERLQLLGSPFALIVIAAATAFAAISLALLVAELSQTSEQATIAAGILNIVMAALGGIMVPRFLMPAVMQDISNYSPMAWGLDGFLDILLRDGGVVDVLPEAGKLFGLGACCMLLVYALSRSQSKTRAGKLKTHTETT